MVVDKCVTVKYGETFGKFPSHSESFRSSFHVGVDPGSQWSDLSGRR